MIKHFKKFIILINWILIHKRWSKKYGKKISRLIGKFESVYKAKVQTFYLANLTKL